MTEIEIGSHQYMVDKLRARQQRNIAKRIVPLLVAAKGLLAEIASKDESIERLFEAAGPIAQAIASMPDADTDYIFDECLGAVRRKTSAGTWQSVITAGELRYEDITLPQQIELTIAVIRESMSDFLPALPGL